MTRFRYIHLIFLVCIPMYGNTQSRPITVSNAIEIALENNYGIIISHLDLDIARLNNNWGTAGRFPTIGFDVSASSTYDLSDNSQSNRVTAGIGANWILFDGFRVNVTKSILENTQELSSGRLGVIVENTIEAVILGYYGVLLEDENLKVLKNLMNLSKDRYDYELHRKSLGSAVTYEVLQAENVYLSDKAAFLDQEMRLRNAKRNFNFLLAADPQSSFTFSESFEADTSHYDLSELQAKMLSNNQTLQNQYINQQLKEEEIKLKEAAYYPTVSAGAGMDNGFSRSKSTASPAIKSNSYAPYGNVRISYDIFNGGIRKRALEIARINQQIEEISTDEMEHDLINELYSLYDFHEVRISLLNVAEKSLQAAELNLELSEDKYRSGAINSFNYRDVQLMYLESSLRRLQAIYNLIDSKTKLTRLTGGYIQVEE